MMSHDQERDLERLRALHARVLETVDGARSNEQIRELLQPALRAALEALAAGRID